MERCPKSDHVPLCSPKPFFIGKSLLFTTAIEPCCCITLEVHYAGLEELVLLHVGGRFIELCNFFENIRL